MSDEPSDDPIPAVPPEADAAEADDTPSPESAAAAPPPEDASDVLAPPPEAPEAPEAPAMEALPLRGTARPEPVDPPARLDPFAKAQEALIQAAAARGAEFTPIPPPRRHPLDAAQDALEKARAAREHASKGGTAGLAREADARAQLASLKGGGPVSRGSTPAPRDPTDPAPPNDGGIPTPRKRRL